MIRVLALVLLSLASRSLWAQAPDPETVQTRTFYIPPGSSPSPDLSQEKVDRSVREFFRAQKIEIPPNGHLSYDFEHSTVALRAPEKVIQQVEELYRPLPASAPDSGELLTRTFGLPKLYETSPTLTQKISDEMVRGFLHARKIEIPPPGFASLDLRSFTLVVRATRKVMEHVQDFVQEEFGFHDIEPVSMRVVFTIVEFSANPTSGLRDLTYDRAREIAGDSWRVLDRSSVTGRSGYKVTSQFVTKGTPLPKPDAARNAAARSKAKAEPPEPKENAFAPNEYGVKIDARPELGLGGETVEVDFTYRYRGAGQGGTGPLELGVESNVSLGHDQPLMAHTQILSSAEGRARMLALVVRASLLNSRGRNLFNLDMTSESIAPAPGR